VRNPHRRTANWLRPINLLAKRTGERSAGNLHAPFDVAGMENNQLTVRLLRHSQRKRGATARSHLRSQAPFLDLPACPLFAADFSELLDLRTPVQIYGPATFNLTTRQRQSFH
jgi:hypothetical protein